MNTILIRKSIVDTNFVNDVTCTRQSVITCVVIHFLWDDVIHWITVMSYDKEIYGISAGPDEIAYNEGSSLSKQD